MSVLDTPCPSCKAKKRRRCVRAALAWKGGPSTPVAIKQPHTRRYEAHIAYLESLLKDAGIT